MPTRAIFPGGVIDLGPDGCAVIAETSMVSFALRTPEEQSALALVDRRPSRGHRQ